MLYLKAVHPDTLSLLINLQQEPLLTPFYLAGGTALALHLGHRKSFDLDLFGQSRLPIEELAGLLKSYPDARELLRSKNITVWSIADVKVDIVNYHYAPIGKPIEENGLRLLSIEDIAAMKLEAIKGRGKKRDFYDLFILLQKYSLKELLSYHQKKFKDDSTFLIVKSLTFFEDAEADPPIIALTHKPDWENVKRTISSEAATLQ